MTSPEPTHGWAYPVQQSTNLPQAHFYQRTTLNRRAICGQAGYRGQQVHTRLLRGVREMCPACYRHAKQMGFIK